MSIFAGVKGKKYIMSGKTKLKKYALDSSATFYPFLTSKKTQSMFSVGVVLDSDIDGDVLGRAVNDAIVRFPFYKTKLVRGYGKYSLKENCAEVKVFEIGSRILKPIDTGLTNGYQFRLAYKGNRIVLEMFHALADANGAIAFLFAVVRRYKELLGAEFDESCEVWSWDGTAREGETEDAFKKHYKKISLKDLNLKDMAGEAPHRIKGTLLKDGYILDEGVFDTAELLASSRELGVSLTAYIAGAVAYGIMKTESVKRPIAIMIPVNLRKMFPSETLANFITFVRLVIKKDECATFEECVRSCAKQLIEKASKEKMQAFVSTTVRAQRNIIFRAVPLPLKWIFMRLGRLFLKSRQTIIISNLGRYELPDELGIREMIVNLNVSKNNVQNLGIVTCDGRTKLTFTSAISELTMPSSVFKTLEERGHKIMKTDFIHTN